VLIDAEKRLATFRRADGAEVGLDLKGFPRPGLVRPVRAEGIAAAIAQRISDEVARIANTADMKDKLLLVAQYAHHQSPADFAKQVADDKAFFTALLKDSTSSSNSGRPETCTAAVRRTHRRGGHSRRRAE